MPKVPSGKKYLKGYSEKDLENAVQAVRDGMPKKTAAVKYKVPRATLQFRLSTKFIKNRPGPSTVLTQEEEDALVNWIITSSRKGFPRRREDLVKSVKDFLDKNPRENKFIDNTSGEGWYKLFMKRHPIITERTSEAVTSASSKVSERQLRNWFKQIEDYLKENNLFHIFNEPSRILNGDETNFMLCPKNTKVIAPKGDRNVYEVDHAQAKSCVTVMFTFSADGKVTPPMIIFPLKKMRMEIQRSVPSEWGIGLSDNGWMQAATFFQYVKNVLHPALVKDNVEFPVFLFVDGHKSHTTLELSQLCQNLGIILIALYPNATRMLQPAYVAAFRPVKTLWRKAVLEWRKAVLEWRINNMTKTLTKTDVGPILKVLIPKIKADTLKNGFRTTGLCPFNPDAVDYSKCLVQSKAGHQQSPTTPKRPSTVLSQEEFHKIIGSDLERRMRNQLIGPSKEAKILYEIFKYFSTKHEKNLAVTKEREESEITKERAEPEMTEEREKPEMTEAREEPETIEKRKAPVIIEERKAPEPTEERKAPEMTKKRKLPEMATQIENLELAEGREPETIKEEEKYDMIKKSESYNIRSGSHIFYNNEARNNKTEENEKTDRTIIIVSEQIENECMNHHQLILQDSDVPEPAEKYEIFTEFSLQPEQRTTSSPQSIDYAHSLATTSRRDIIYTDGKWVPLNKIPVTVAQENPAKKTLGNFLVFPKTPIKKIGKNQEHRSFVLTSREWENEELKKQNKKLEVIQLKEEKKKQRLEKAEEKRLNKERKQTENLKKKSIKIESQSQKKKTTKEKPKIIQNILIKPANFNDKPTTMTKKIQKDNTIGKEENYKDIHRTEDQQENSNQTRKKKKLSKPLTDEDLTKILEDD